MASATLALSAPTRAACLQSPRKNALLPLQRSLQAPRRATTSNRQRLSVSPQAMLPGIVPIVARSITAGVVFYCSMNWVMYRGARKDAEKYIDEAKSKADKRRASFEKLTRGKADKDA